MSRPRLVNLLDDFALGGVSRGLGVFDAAAVRAVVDPSVMAFKPDAVIAPRCVADVIVTHFPPNWRRIAFLASLRLRNPRARIIHVEHSYTRAWEANNVPQKPRFRAMLKLALRLVDQVVCVSNGQADWLSEAAGLKRDRIKVIYPYANNPGLAELALPDFSGTAPIRMGTYGRFHEAKGFDRLIEAFGAGLFPGMELVIGGFGAGEARLHQLAEGIPGIRFYGKVTNVADFLAECDVVAVPSRWEAFGQVATEAREAGRPILTSPVDGLAEQVGTAGLVIDFTSDQAIAQAVASLDRDTLPAMAQAARAETADCGLHRQQQWADLLTASAPPTARQTADTIALTQPSPVV
jgi:glycosyltransferase involved in cell wall biosynthesis